MSLCVRREAAGWDHAATGTRPGTPGPWDPGTSAPLDPWDPGTSGGLFYLVFSDLIDSAPPGLV